MRHVDRDRLVEAAGLSQAATQRDQVLDPPHVGDRLDGEGIQIRDGAVEVAGGLAGARPQPQCALGQVGRVRPRQFGEHLIGHRQRLRRVLGRQAELGEVDPRLDGRPPIARYPGQQLLERRTDALRKRGEHPDSRTPATTLDATDVRRFDDVTGKLHL